MQRYLDFTTFAPSKWPGKYKNDFLSVLEKHQYDKGSLKQNSFKEKNIAVTNILPLEEHAFTTRTIASLQHILSALYPEENYNVLMLHFRCNAIKFNNFTLGAKDSRYQKASILLVMPNLNSTETLLCEVQYFMKCKLAKSFDEGAPHIIMWFAAVQLMMEHQCKVWFGFPVEVCSTAPAAFDFTFIPVSSIQSRVVYIKTTFNFGRIIGDDSVYIAILLEKGTLDE